MQSGAFDDVVKSGDYTLKNGLRVLGALLFTLVVVVIAYFLVSYFSCPKTSKKSFTFNVPDLTSEQYVEFFIPSGYIVDSVSWSAGQSASRPVINLADIHVDSFTGCVSVSGEDLAPHIGQTVTCELKLRSIAKTSNVPLKSNLVSFIS